MYERFPLGKEAQLAFIYKLPREDSADRVGRWSGCAREIEKPYQYSISPITFHWKFQELNNHFDMISTVEYQLRVRPFNGNLCTNATSITRRL